MRNPFKSSVSEDSSTVRCHDYDVIRCRNLMSTRQINNRCMNMFDSSIGHRCRDARALQSSMHERWAVCGRKQMLVSIRIPRPKLRSTYVHINVSVTFIPGNEHTYSRTVRKLKSREVLIFCTYVVFYDHTFTKQCVQKHFFCPA